MPFEEGNKLSPGRKGFEFERVQLIKMRSLLDKDLRLLEKLYAGKISKKDLVKLQIAQARMMKILDKLHASKQSIGGDEDNPLRVVVLPEAVAKSFNINATDTETKSSDTEQGEI